MRSRATRRRLPPLGLTGLFLAFAAALALIPYTVTTGLIRVRRLRARAKTFRCPKCDRALGLEALRLPDAVRARVFDEVAATKEFGRWDRAQSVDAVCAHCGTPFHFDEPARNFVAVDLGPPIPGRPSSGVAGEFPEPGRR